MNHFEYLVIKGHNGLEKNWNVKNNYLVNCSQVMDKLPSPPIKFPAWQNRSVLGMGRGSDHPCTNEASLVAQTVKNSPATWETWVQSLGWEDPLEKGMANHSNILAWKIPMARGAWCATVHGVAKSQTQLSEQPTPPPNITAWVAYKQQKFISHSSGGWKSKIRVSTW